MFGLQLRLRARLRNLALGLGGTIFIFGFLLLGRQSVWEVDFQDAHLRLEGFRVVFEGRPFTGMIVERYPDGSLSRWALALNGRRYYKELQWYPDGLRQSELPFVAGVPHGAAKTWHRTGEPQSLKSYVDGMEHGEAWSWNPRGDLIEYRVTDHGREVAYKAFTFDRKVYYNYVYRDGERVGVQAGQFCKTKKQQFN